MPRIKHLVALVFFVAPLIVSSNSFAFNMPKEFASLGIKSISHKNSFAEKDNFIKMTNGSDAENIRSAILSQYSNWKGTRYHLGGTTHNGVDCSALMQKIFSASFGQSLPRTTTQQIHNGQQVSKETLKPGDLVFFKTSPGQRHVGVYVGDNKFIHASSSEGVTMSSLANHYWVEHYETARRLKVMG
ncbi:NlpC/P60 family protein [Buttiauxella selenatireducens]|uniref:NlpC/P60 family protein n=1 Tax=Buttiauxella selenatireducens TaxID=3073902 RepID=A0ABY9S9T4_9ENTR|nr:NlpC/P60 family protein [Buttiauxella sp. R73]WMY73748.1 NlpC/P60 family protein [Buttiauxella sp. R73]